MSAWMLPYEAIVDLPPEMAGGLTFHLPMEWVALRVAGASAAIIEDRARARLIEAYAAGLVDPPMYRWAVQRYGPVAEALLSNDAATRSAAFRSVEPLGEGLAGAAFHGLIRLGYAAWQRDENEVARGLAYLRTRRQVLAGAHVPDAAEVGPSVSVDLPGLRQRDGATVFDLLSIAAGSGHPARLASEARSGQIPVLLQTGLDLVRRNPSSFVAVHALTGFHALCEVHILVCGEPPTDVSGSPLASWWDAFGVASAACALLVHSEPPEPTIPKVPVRNSSGSLPNDPPDSVATVAAMVSAAAESDDTHDVKVAVALQRLVSFGMLSEDEAVSVGRTRLAATHFGDVG